MLKKFIKITGIVTLISLCLATISFFIFDIGKMVKYMNLQKILNSSSNHKTSKIKRLEEKIDNLGDIIEDMADKKADEIEEKYDNLSDNIEDAIEDIVDKKTDNLTNFINNNIGNMINKILTKVTWSAFNYTDFLDEYLNEKQILKNHQHYKIIKKQVQKIDKIDNINIDIKNANLVFGKTKSNNIKLYLLKYKNNLNDMPYAYNFKIKDKDFKISLLEKNNNYEHDNFLLFILIPDKYKGKISADFLNSSAVFLYQKSNIVLDSKNSDLVFLQKANNNIKANISNSNIVTTLLDKPNLKTNLKFINSNIILFDKILYSYDNVKSNIQSYGNGEYEWDFSIKNSNMVISAK